MKKLTDAEFNSLSLVEQFKWVVKTLDELYELHLKRREIEKEGENPNEND